MIRESEYVVHPATLDGCLQAAFIATQDRAVASPSRAFLPSRINSMTISASHILSEHSAVVQGSGRLRGLRQANTKFELLSVHDETVVVADVTFASVEGGFGSAHKLPPQPYQQIRWVARPDILFSSEAQQSSPPVSNGTNGVAVDQQRTSGPESTHPLWLIFDDSSPQQVLKPLLSNLHPLARLATISDISTLPRGACVVLLAHLDMTSMDESMFKNMQIMFQKASRIIWTTWGDDPAAFLMHGMMKVLETEHPNVSILYFDFENTHDGMAVAANAISRVLTNLSNGVRMAEKHISIRGGVPYTSQYVLNEGDNANEQALHRVMTVEGKYTPGLALDMQYVGRPDSAFFKSTSSSVSQIDLPTNVLVRPIYYGMTQREARSLLGKDQSTCLSRELLGVVERVTGNSALKVGQEVISLALGSFESEVEVPEALCLPAGSDSSMIGQMAPFCIAVEAVVDIGRVREGDCVLVHCGSSLLTVNAAQVAQQAGAQVRTSTNSVQCKTDLIRFSSSVKRKIRKNTWCSIAVCATTI